MPSQQQLADEVKEKIYKGWRSIPDDKLLDFLKKGISLSKLEASASPKELQRLERLKKELKKEENDLWNAATKSDDIYDYRRYLDCYGENALYANEAHEALKRKEEEMWQSLKANPTQEGIDAYRNAFPQGSFLQECKDLESDLPWYIAKSKNSIEELLKYKQQYPGKHEAEIEQLIEKIRDNKAWETAEKIKSTDAYIRYIDEHAGLEKKFGDFDNKILGDYISYLRGKSPSNTCQHFEEARRKIENRGGKEILLDELRKDPNCYSVTKLRNEIDSIADMRLEDLKEIFTDEQVRAIEDYEEPKQLDVVQDTDQKLRRGFTEVYFWGLRKTGKTCAIGATIGYLSNVRKSLNPEPCPGQQYLLQLQNLFSRKGAICKLPPGTPMGNLPAMSFTFNDSKGDEHRVTFIDVAGEVFSAIYAQKNGITLNPEEQKAIKNLENRLKDNYNNKIHFFIIEYGDDNGEVAVRDGLYASKSQVMYSLAQYFDKQNIFNDSSVSMNLLVTKCDRIKKGDRMEEVKRYVEESGWAPAKNGINDISCNARTGCLFGMGFSIGEVFAQDLCVFRPDDAEGIVEEIEYRTPAYKHNWWSRLIDFFRK